MFIDLYDPKTDRTSALSIPENYEGPALLIGALPHCTHFYPKTIEDAQQMQAWLEVFIRNKQAEIDDEANAG